LPVPQPGEEKSSLRRTLPALGRDDSCPGVLIPGNNDRTKLGENAVAAIQVPTRANMIIKAIKPQVRTDEFFIGFPAAFLRAVC
jgi:hypothetical protein